MALAAAALDGQNDVIRKAGPVDVAVAFTTGTLVKVGYGLDEMPRGGSRFGWMPCASLWDRRSSAPRPFRRRLQGLRAAVATCAALAGPGTEA